MTDGERLDREDGRSLRSGFLHQAKTRPDAIALVVDGREYRYRDLRERACLWANAIMDRLGGRPARVGIFAYRSETAYTGVLAALFSGATFVPLNRTYPVARTSAMVDAANLDAIIVDDKSCHQLSEVLKTIKKSPLILIPGEFDVGDALRHSCLITRHDLDASTSLTHFPAVSTTEIAYLLFTSGSTGAPKGVAVAHSNVLHFLDVMTTRYGINHEDRFSQTFDQTFDLSIFDLFVAWECGACVCVPQPLDLIAPVRFVNKNNLTLWFSVPSVAALCMKKGSLTANSLPTLRWSLFCGEPLSRNIVEAWQNAAPESIVENLYGPTELTIACLVHRWDPVCSRESCVNDIVPIGRPFPGLGVAVVDENMKIVSRGQTGELCVCGPQTVPGYWRALDKTRERFVELVQADLHSVQFYKTGDRVQRLPNGEYAYLGRTDHQIKVLGHRVELGEIEAAILRQPGVLQAVAFGWPVKDATAQGIVAVVVGNKINLEDIESNVRQTLPDYMVPNRILCISEMPMNANGKVDRNKLLQQIDHNN